MRFATYLVAAISMVSTTLAAVTPATPVEKRFKLGPSQNSCSHYGFICPPIVNGNNLVSAVDTTGSTTCNYSNGNNKYCSYDSDTGELSLSKGLGTYCPGEVSKGCQDTRNTGITLSRKRKLSKAEKRLARSQYNPKKRLAAVDEE